MMQYGGSGGYICCELYLEFAGPVVLEPLDRTAGGGGRP